jgi:LytS/YehU family sensor histidine kinase
MTTRLGEFLRMTLEGDPSPLIPLSQELTFLRHYLAIEQVRFGDRLRVDEEVDLSLLSAQVPNMILQPLVENAIRHGLSNRARGGLLRICVQKDQDHMQLQIIDDGVGLPEEMRLGVGLSNVQSRLTHLYGASAEFNIRDRHNDGVVATLRIPIGHGVQS